MLRLGGLVSKQFTLIGLINDSNDRIIGIDRTAASGHNPRGAQRFRFTR